MASSEAAATSLAGLCSEAKLSTESTALVVQSNTQLSHWVALLTDQRPAFLRALQTLGVASLKERQAFANALAKAKRESRLGEDCEQNACAAREGLARDRLARMWERDASPPPIDEIERDAAARLRARPELLPPAASSASTDAALIRAIPAAERAAMLETVDLPSLHASTLLGSVGVRGLRVGFYSNQLCERGTETALYDYADCAERLLGTCSYILYDATSRKNVAASVERFRARFGERLVPLGATSGSPWADVAPALRSRRITHCYVIKFGHPDEPDIRRFNDWYGGAAGGVQGGGEGGGEGDGDGGDGCAGEVEMVPFRTRVLVHAVFDGRTPHGDAYAKISPCVPSVGLNVPVVPHIVRRRACEGTDLRAELGIPPDATVFGRHGGYDVFDILEAREAVLSVARQRADIYFVLLNTKPLRMDEYGQAAWDKLPRNIIHLEATLDEARKAAFILTCDAMIHARRSGESFGLAVCTQAHLEHTLTSEHCHAADDLTHTCVLPVCSVADRRVLCRQPAGAHLQCAPRQWHGALPH